MALDPKQFKDLIERTLRELGANSPAAVNLLLGTAAKESHLGTYIHQVDGPALGFFGMEPDTEFDIWANFMPSRTRLRDRLINATGRIGPNVRALETHIAYQICMCRIQYLRFREPLPNANDVYVMGRYWKKYYNTDKGKGTIEDFIACYQRFVIGGSG